MRSSYEPQRKQSRNGSSAAQRHAGRALVRHAKLSGRYGVSPLEWVAAHAVAAGERPFSGKKLQAKAFAHGSGMPGVKYIVACTKTMRRYMCMEMKQFVVFPFSTQLREISADRVEVDQQALVFKTSGKADILIAVSDVMCWEQLEVLDGEIVMRTP